MHVTILINSDQFLLAARSYVLLSKFSFTVCLLVWVTADVGGHFVGTVERGGR